jgi:hypothetical protein
VTVRLGSSLKLALNTKDHLAKKIKSECKVEFKWEHDRLTQITGDERRVYEALRRLTAVDTAAVRPGVQVKAPSVDVGMNTKDARVHESERLGSDGRYDPTDGAAGDRAARGKNGDEVHSTVVKQSVSYEVTDERLRTRAINVEDYAWDYVQHKYPGIVAKFAEKFHVKLEFQDFYDKDGKKYSKLQVSSGDQAKLNEAFENLANIVQEKFGKVSDFVIEMKTDDADCVKDLVRNEGFIVMPQSSYHITGPSHSIEQARRKVVQMLIDKYGLKKTTEYAYLVDSVGEKPSAAAQLKKDEKKHDGVVFSFHSSSGIDVRICRGNVDFEMFCFLLTFYVPMVL